MPNEAIHKQRRDNLKLSHISSATPVNWQRLRKRTGEESLGILLRAIRAA